MQYNDYELRELAEQIYDLDTEVVEKLGSSLGRVFIGEREQCIQRLLNIMHNANQSNVLRSELALISNMARTIRNKEERKQVMYKYNKILEMVVNLPTNFSSIDIVDQNMAKLNMLNLKNRFSKKDHLIICISRTYGCGGGEIGFRLADALKINYYDVEIFKEVLRRMEAERDHVLENDVPYSSNNVFTDSAFTPNKKTLKQRMRDFSRYHGLPEKDALFFNQSNLIRDMAKKENCIIMGRCADVILTNNNIPHISIFITAPMEQRVHRVMLINEGLNEKQVRKMVNRLDHNHMRYYKNYTGREWGKGSNYDLCINSACYGIEGSVDLIMRMLNKE